MSHDSHDSFYAKRRQYIDEVLFDRKSKPLVRLLGIAIAQRCNRGSGDTFTDISTLAARLGVKWSDCVKAANALEKAGRLKITRRGAKDETSRGRIHLEPGERARAVGNMRAVMVGEDPKHAIKLGARYVSAFSYQSSLDHAAPATADHSPCIIVGNRRQAFAGDDEVERRYQIGRCIDQRAVEIEHDGAHDSRIGTSICAGSRAFAALGSPP
jgi:hypothetical protein